MLRRAGEAYRAQNIQQRFAQGATVMFWGAILSGHSGKLLFNCITTTTTTTTTTITTITIIIIILMYINANKILY